MAQNKYYSIDSLTDNEWKIALSDEFNKEYFQELLAKLNKRVDENVEIYPKPDDLFAAFNKCPLDTVRVVLIGQDPYHGPGQANGLSFSVNKNVPIPPSLKRIFQELEDDLNIRPSENSGGDLSKWAEEGVLMLNATLTVERGSPNSHKDYGWQQFTDFVIEYLNSKYENIIYLLMGNFAKMKCKNINRRDNYVISIAHPSPLCQRGFLGTKPFSRINSYLSSIDDPEIDFRT